MSDRFLAYGTSSYQYFVDGLCGFEPFERGQMTRHVFPDGERYQRLTAPVRGRDVIVVGGTVSDQETLELYDLAYGLVQYGVDTLAIVAPYYGYSTMERAVRPGEVITGKTRAMLLSSIPRARICNEILMVDLHTEGIMHYFEGSIRPYHIYAKRLIADIIRGLPDSSDIVLASTDAGRAKWVETLANELGVDAAFVYKRRLSGKETQIRGINADVRGRHVVVYDDMIRTGGSLIKAGQAYRDAGAAKLTAVATHGVLPGDSLERIRQAALFDRVVTTDTHPRAKSLFQEDEHGFFYVYSIIPDVADFLEKRADFNAEGLVNE